MELRDLNDAGRVGWREMLVRAPGLPGRDVSDELRAYPDDLLQSPLDVRRVGFRVLPGGAVDPWIARRRGPGRGREQVGPRAGWPGRAPAGHPSPAPRASLRRC